MESTTWPLAVEGSDAPDDDAPHGAPAAPTPVVCEQCRKEPSKVSGRCRHVWCNWMERRQYCCPGCFVKTCSVECVRAHKLARDCDGRRKRSDFVALNNFTDENMWSDISFLGEVEKRSTKSQKDIPKPSRLRKGHHLQGGSGGGGGGGAEPQRALASLPVRYKKLLQQARHRDVNLRFMSDGMKRHTCNTSMHHFKSNSILWKVDVLFHGTPIAVELEKQSDAGTIAQILETAITSIMATQGRHKLPESFLRHRQDLGQLVVAYKVPFRPANADRFIALAYASKLQAALAGLTVIEYPTLYVFSPEDRGKATWFTAEEEEELRKQVHFRRKRPRIEQVASDDDDESMAGPSTASTSTAMDVDGAAAPRLFKEVEPEGDGEGDDMDDLDDDDDDDLDDDLIHRSHPSAAAATASAATSQGAAQSSSNALLELEDDFDVGGAHKAPQVDATTLAQALAMAVAGDLGVSASSD